MLGRIMKKCNLCYLESYLEIAITGACLFWSPPDCCGSRFLAYINLALLTAKIKNKKE